MSEYKLIVQEKVLPVIKFSHEEILKQLEETLTKYQNIVLTEDTVQDNKKILAELNKAKKEVNEFMIKTDKEMSKPIKDFRDIGKMINGKIDEVYDPIKIQIDKYVEELKKIRAEDVELVINQTQEEIPLKEKYLVQVERKDKYLNSSETINKIKADVVEQFNSLKMQQDMEQMKIDTINAILSVHNDKLRFKFSFDDFERYIDTSTVAEINTLVNDKVNGRITEEKAEVERIEREKQEAIQKAKEEAERKAKEEAERKEAELKAKEEADIKAREEADREKERLHQNELRKLEIESQLKIQETMKAAAQATEMVEAFIPVEAVEGEAVNDYMLEIKATQNQLEKIKNYLENSGVELLHVEVL